MKKVMSQGAQALKRAVCWMKGHKLRVAVVVLALVMVAPRPLQSQFFDPCCAILSAGLSTITKTLSTVIGNGLNNILSVERTIQNFEQSVVWPLELINQARSLAASVQNIYGEIWGVTAIPVNSATLAATQRLEQNLLSADAGQISQLSANFAAVYGPLPATTEAPVEVRNMVDMTDAVAEAALKRAIEIDALANLELEAAERISQSIPNASPGSAPIIEAQADAWLVRANAYTQAATADLMRVRAIALANAGAEVKIGARNTTDLGQQLINLLKRQ